MTSTLSRTHDASPSDEAIFAYGRARSTVEGTPLSPDELHKIDAYWRASLYLCLGMLYLKAWSLSGQHTGRTDLPLTERGERNAHALGERLRGLTFVKVYTSPLQRATRTCQLAGFAHAAEIDPDLVEWDYGQYEGRRTAEIHAQRPDWQLFRDGCPGGESPHQIGARADRVMGRMRAIKGDVLVFSHGNFLRVFAARWLGLDAAGGQYFLLSTASLSALGYEHKLVKPAIRLWNDDRHVKT